MGALSTTYTVFTSFRILEDERVHIFRSNLANVMICVCSQAEIEDVLNAVKVGPFYLSRLVETADQLLTEEAQPSSSVPS